MKRLVSPLNEIIPGQQTLDNPVFGGLHLTQERPVFGLTLTILFETPFRILGQGQQAGESSDFHRSSSCRADQETSFLSPCGCTEPGWVGCRLTRSGKKDSSISTVYLYPSMKKPDKPLPGRETRQSRESWFERHNFSRHGHYIGSDIVSWQLSTYLYSMQIQKIPTTIARV